MKTETVRNAIENKRSRVEDACVLNPGDYTRGDRPTGEKRGGIVWNSLKSPGVAKAGAWDAAGWRDRTEAGGAGQGWTPGIVRPRCPCEPGFFFFEADVSGSRPP